MKSFLTAVGRRAAQRSDTSPHSTNARQTAGHNTLYEIHAWQRPPLRDPRPKISSRCSVSLEPLEDAVKIADFTNLKFEPIKAPDVASRWPKR